jgi:hypothetical protein
VDPDPQHCLFCVGKGGGTFHKLNLKKKFEMATYCCRNSELFQLLEVADAELLLASCRQLLTGGSRDPERQCFLAQKLASVLPSVRRDYATLARATQVASRNREQIS